MSQPTSTPIAPIDASLEMTEMVRQLMIANKALETKMDEMSAKLDKLLLANSDAGAPKSKKSKSTKSSSGITRHPKYDKLTPASYKSSTQLLVGMIRSYDEALKEILGPKYTKILEDSIVSVKKDKAGKNFNDYRISQSIARSMKDTIKTTEDCTIVEFMNLIEAHRELLVSEIKNASVSRLVEETSPSVQEETAINSVTE